LEEFLTTETLIIGLLLIASLVAILVRRLHTPYPVALVVVGLLITFQQPVELHLTPELILVLFVPPLVFEAAFHINLGDLRRDWTFIGLLAVPGVILSMFIIGGILAFTTPLGLSLGLVFGALIAATDPVAVVSLFRAIGVPKRLAGLVETESLFNDGTAIVVFRLVLLAALSGQFNLVQGAANFLQVAVGGVVIGLALGWVIARLIARIDDYLIETTLTTVLAFGSYLAAESLGFSGVLAVAAAGLVNGNLGPQGMSPTTRIVLFNFWEYAAFLANSLIFLLIGLQVNIPALVANALPIGMAIAAVLIARVVVVYGLGFLANRFIEPVSLRWQTVMVWGGLRGAISLALALSLPEALGPSRALLQTMAFGVVLFSLVVQGTTMRSLVRRLGIVVRTDAQVAYELGHARLTALRAALRHLDRLHREGLLSTHAWEQLRPGLDQQVEAMAGQVREVLRSEPEIESEELDTAQRELLRAQRSALDGLRRDGVISDDVFAQLASEVDVYLDQTELQLPQDRKLSVSGSGLDDDE
jgi:CPA1 family monovalent cation:H+ antiporter